MSKFKYTGHKCALHDPVQQWEITRQLLQQDGIRRKFTIEKGYGEVILDEGAKVTDFINLLKAGKFRGELDLVAELAKGMGAIYADRQRSLLHEIQEILDPLEKSFIPPKAVASAAARGLELRRKYGRGGLDVREAAKQGIGSGVQRAVNLKNRDAVSAETVKRMKSFFARHRKNKDGKTDKGEPSAGAIAWLLWGGDAGDRWSQSIVNQLEKDKK